MLACPFKCRSAATSTTVCANVLSPRRGLGTASRTAGRRLLSGGAPPAVLFLCGLRQHRRRDAFAAQLPATHRAPPVAQGEQQDRVALAAAVAGFTAFDFDRVLVTLALLRGTFVRHQLTARRQLAYCGVQHTVLGRAFVEGLAPFSSLLLGSPERVNSTPPARARLGANSAREVSVHAPTLTPCSVRDKSRFKKERGPTEQAGPAPAHCRHTLGQPRPFNNLYKDCG